MCAPRASYIGTSCYCHSKCHDDEEEWTSLSLLHQDEEKEDNTAWVDVVMFVCPRLLGNTTKEEEEDDTTLMDVAMVVLVTRRRRRDVCLDDVLV